MLSGLVLVATMAGASAAAGATDHTRQSPVSVQAPAADTPSPTLGSTPQPGVNPPGDADADPSDFDQVPLAVGSFLFLGALVGGSILFYLWRRSRQNTGSTD
ncbi:hypothetical protein [Kribbella swartbergensis]